MTSKNQSAEDILAQLHGNDDDSGDSDEDLDLGLDKLKTKSNQAANAGTSEAENPDVSPLTEEKERHKKNLM